MATNSPIVPDPTTDTPTNEETIALRKKRSRRVSFADREITSVHIFNRDEDYETPPDSSSAKNSICEPYDEVRDFFRDLAESDDSKDMSPIGPDDDDDGDDVDGRKPFFRPIESPSPGNSSIIGSATSNDEDNFFGPVSASFIRPGRLSDSVASDDNHDVTMDSTAFSMHYRSIVRSESGGDINTPTAVSVAVEEKTPFYLTTPDPGSFMVLTKAKKVNLERPFVSENGSGGRDSNDMSLVGEKSRSYDYEKLSPELEALLAEGCKNLLAATASGSDSTNLKSLEGSEVSLFDQNGNVCTIDSFCNGLSVACMELDEANSISVANVGDHVTHDSCANRTEDVTANASIHHQVQPIQMIKVPTPYQPSNTQTPDQRGNVQDPSQPSQAPTAYQPSNTQNPDQRDNAQAPSPPSKAQTLSEVQTPSQTSKLHTPNHLSKLQTPNQMNKVNNDYRKAAIAMHTEFPALNGVIPSNMGGGLLELNSLTEHESGQCPIEGLLKEISNKDGRNNHDIYQTSDQLHGSVLSLSATKQQIFSDTSKSCNQLLYVTPSPKQSGSFLSKENMRSGGIDLSLHKSSSKFKMFEPSPLACSLKDGIEKSKLRLSKFLLPATFPFNSVVEENSKGMEAKHVDVPIVNLEKHLYSVNMKNRDPERTSNLDSYIAGSPNTIGDLSKHGGITSLLEDEESLIHISPRIFSKGNARLITGLPSQISWSQRKVRQHTLLENSMEAASVNAGSGSSLVQIKLDGRNHMKLTNAQDSLVSPSVKALNQKLSLPIEPHRGSLSGEAVSIGSGQGWNPVGNVPSSLHSIAITDTSCFAEGRPESSSLLLDINHSEDHSQVKWVDDRKGFLHDMPHALEPSMNFQTPLKERNAPNIHSGSSEGVILVATDLACAEEEIPKERNKSSPYTFVSPCSPSSMNEPSLKSPSKKNPNQSPMMGLAQSPPRKEPCNVLNNDHVQPPVAQEILSPNSNSDGDGIIDSHLGLHNSQRLLPAEDTKFSSGQKRRTEEPVAEDADQAEKTWRIKTSPNKRARHFDMKLKSESSNGSINEMEMVVCDTTAKHWTDVLLKFSDDTKQMLSPSIDKLNMRAVAILQDILVQLQKVKKFEMLCSQIQSQKMCDLSSKARHKRVDETRLVLSKLVCEKARLQLMSVKHDKLLKRAKELNSVIQESKMLKSNSMWHSCVPGERDIPVNDNLQDSSKAQCDSKIEDSSEKVVRMRHELEVLDWKIKSLTKSFHGYCKMKGEPSCSETILLVKDHLRKRTACRFISEDLQLWKVEELSSSDGQQIIVLNYQGFIHQRFAINAVPNCSIFISNQLNDITITKNFPNIEACVAFAHVLNSETTKKYVGSKSLAHETQMTGSLLHNVLDVIEEVQLAQIEIRNLVQTTFSSPSVNQLDLLLWFIDFNTGRKVTITLDMTCLNRGIYPSEILPCWLQASINGTHKPLPKSLSADIEAAVDGLTFGFQRIARLCRCVSQVVQS